MYDLFVEGLLFLIIFPPIIYGYLRVFELGGEYFYVFLQIFALLITIVLTWIHPNFIAPLFNEFKELTNTNLRMKIYTMANRTKFPIKNILVMNSSVRSSHLNAYFYGFGSKKVIVLYDTLLRSLSDEEIVSVISHEMGHSYYKHSLQKLFVYLLQTLSIFYIFGFFMKN